MDKILESLKKSKLLRILILLVIFSWLCNSSFRVIRISGDSMEPYYEHGDIVLVDVLSKRFKPLKRFDIVIARDAEGDNIIKRIVGLPNETVKYENRNFYINGRLLEYDHFNNKTDFEMEINEFKIPEGKYFLIGDNRTTSIFGVYEKKRVIGKVIF